MSKRLAVALVAAFSLSLAACGDGGLDGGDGGDRKTVTVGAAGGFTESQILGHMYVELLGDAGYNAELTTVQTRQLYFPLLESGEIGVMPEYAASFTEHLNKEANGPDAATVASSDIEETMIELRELTEPLGLEALEPTEAVDQNTFVVSEDFAAEHNLETLSDLGESGLTVKIAAGEDCFDPAQTYCKPGLERVYGIQLGDLVPTGVGSLQTKTAVQQGEAELGLVLSTDATLPDFGLVALEDDQQLQLSDNVVPVVNTDAAGDPEIAEALNKLAPVLTTDDLAQLNKQVDVERQKAEDVAKEYLESKNLTG